VVDESSRELELLVSVQGMLGYLNLSTGKPDARFQKQLDDAYAFFADRGEAEPHLAIRRMLTARLAELRDGGTGAFRDTRQAEAVLALVFDRVLPAYRAHHADLLFHQSERDLFQPFFLARVFETVLAQEPFQDNPDRTVGTVLNRLNDYVGHRPIAILETRPRAEPYAHERVRPIPLHLHGAGVAHGPYRGLVAKALEILNHTDPALLAEAWFDPAALEEFAVDPRAYDHAHPLNRRPNQVFGEWDPHHIDNRGRYRRYVARQITLDALLARIAQRGSLPQDEMLFEAAAVLAGTVLMATGVSGAGPDTHDSSTSLATLLPRIARYREAFYTQWLSKLDGSHGERLRAEAKTVRQPFGGARQHLNQYLARNRALQLQQRHLALLMAELGYGEASRRQAAQMPAASVRLFTEIHLHLTAGRLDVERGDLASAAEQLPLIDNLLHTGIACGALPDPWNILGFQGLYPLFTAMEDSVRDQRIDGLVHAVDQFLTLHARIMSEAAAAGNSALVARLTASMRKLASWWDQFATLEVAEVRHVHGREAAASAEHVATALSHWRERGEATADLAFWRQHLEGFRSPKAFALVVDALLNKHDYRAAMALLVNWVSQHEQVPLEDGEHSFHPLALRWMLGLSALVKQASPVPLQPFDLAAKFIDYLEANAEDYWDVPRLSPLDAEDEDATEDADAEEELFGAAYEGVTYRDSTDDEVEGEVLETGPHQDFDLEHEGERLEGHLRFLSTMARLWNLATRVATADGDKADVPAERMERCRAWLGRVRQNYQGLLGLLDAVHDYPVPEPIGSYDSVVEFDRRRALKERLLHGIIATCLDTALAVGALQGTVRPSPGAAPGAKVHGKSPVWEPLVIRIEQALWRGDAATVQELLPQFLEAFRDEPLLFTPLTHGGHPLQILRATIAQTILRALGANLPRVGLVRETYQLLRTAHEMEQGQPMQGPRVTEFDRLFQIAFQAVVHAVVDAGAAAEPAPSDQALVELLENTVEPFLALWIEHSKTLRVAVLEAIDTDADWDRLQSFIARYGAGVFHARFMTLGNLRGILHRGVGVFLDHLRDNPDPLHPVHLIDDLDQAIPRREAEAALEIILQAVIENYEEYKDYNTTTPQSDYGENLHTLLAFLRLKAGYERHAWQLRPLLQAHEVLARRRSPAAALWQEQVAELTREVADQHVEELARLQKATGMHLRTVADRIEERFVKPLALDRLCALIEPAMDEALHPQRGQTAFVQLEAGLQAYSDTPTGVGLDVPDWLRRLEGEVQRIRLARTAVATLAESQFQIPKIIASLDQLGRQMSDEDSQQ
jgi:hypothetical protein